MGSYDQIIWPVIGTSKKEKGLIKITSSKGIVWYKTLKGPINVEIHFKRGRYNTASI